LLAEFERHIASWKLIPSRGGVFEITVNGELLYSKKQTGRHVEIDHVRQLFKAKIK